jgi:hypothetical protein
MGWKDASNVVIDIKKTKGTAYEGTYSGKKDIATEIGPQVIWQFTGEDNLPFGIYGFTNLNRAMESLQPGTMCRITYIGTQNVKTKYGMKDVHQVSVQVWEENENNPKI